MFGEMRSALSIPKSVDILDHIYSLPTPEAQEEGMQKIRDIESQAMIAQKPQPGLNALMDFLKSHSLKLGICTRNFDTPVNHLLQNFLPTHEFLPIITRDFRPPKPDPAGILHIAKDWGMLGSDGLAEGIIMVGDSIDDMTAGHRAGAATVLLVNDVNEALRDHEHTDFCITRLDDLIGVLDKGFIGKSDDA